MSFDFGEEYVVCHDTIPQFAIAVDYFSPILKLFNIFLGKILDIMAKNLESWSGCIRSWSRLPRSWPRSIRFFRWGVGTVVQRTRLEGQRV